MKTYFTSDTHLNQQRTLQLSKRPFDTLQEMNNTIVQNWNKIVKQNDTVIHLGDFGDLSFMDKLNGKIILLLGNYERDDKQFDKRIQPYVKSGKVKLKTKPFNLKIGQNTFQLTHQPSLNVEDRKNFELYGHIHRLQVVKKNALNVGCDCHYFKPISLQDVLWQKNAILNHYDEYVFCE